MIVNTTPVNGTLIDASRQYATGTVVYCIERFAGRSDRFVKLAEAGGRHNDLYAKAKCVPLEKIC
jgi:hypothetical protein